MQDILELWAGVRRFAMKQARKWPLEGTGATLDDMEQGGFIALVNALNGYDEGKGSFLNWYAVHLKAAFAEVTGRRTVRQQKDPLAAALSLDAAMTDTEGEPFTLADIVPDPAAEAAMQSVDERDRLEHLRAALATALEALPEEQRTAIVAEFWHGQKVDAKTRNKALSTLRKPEHSKALRQFLKH